MRTALLKLAATSGGIVLGLGILAVSLYWYTTRPKGWDSQSVTARFKTLSIYDEAKPKEHVYYVNILYDVSNNSSRDYTLPIEAWSGKMLESKSGSLLGGAGWELSLSEGNLPTVVPKDFFDPKPVQIRAHTTVELLLTTQQTYALDAVEGKSKEQVMRKEFGDVDSLVVFDNAEHVRIDFPLKNAWKIQ